MSIKSTTEENGHRHISYIREQPDPDTGIIGLTSEVNGHAHNILFIPEKVQVDPATGAQIIIPSRLEVEENNGHNHDLLKDYIRINPELRDKTPKGDPEQYERLNEYMGVAASAYDQDNEAFYPNGEEAEKLFFGGDEQWPEHIRAQLDEAGRPYLTFNIIKGKVNDLAGFFSANPISLRFKPTEGSDARVSDIANATISHILESNDYGALHDDLRIDQILSGRGHLELAISTEKNPEGDIILTKPEWNSVAYLPHSKKDLSDCQGMVAWTYVTKDYLKMVIGEENKSAQSKIDELSSGWPKHTGSSLPYYKDIDKTFLYMRVTRKEYKKRSVIFNSADVYFLDGQENRLASWLLPPSERKAILSIPGFEEKKIDVSEFWVGTIGGNVLLADQLSEFNGFCTIPFYATKRGMRVKGEVVPDLVGPQHETNKRLSAAIENITKFGSNVVIHTPEAFGGNEKMKRDFKSGRARPGSLLEVADLSEIKEETSAPFPSDFTQWVATMERQLDLISGFNAEGISGTRGAQSTPLFKERRAAALDGLSYLDRNFKIGLRLLGLRILEAIRNFYTPDRIYRILEDHHYKLSQDNGPGLTIGGQSFNMVDKEAVQDIFDNSELAKLDVVIDFTNYSTTKAEADFQQWAALASQGVSGIDGDFLLKLRTDLPPAQKESLFESVNRQSQMAAQAESVKYDTELQKTQIGQQGQNERQAKQLQADTAAKMADLALEQEKIRRNR